MLRETTSRGRCELVCPSRTNERGGEGYCVTEGGGEEGERERERAGEVRLYGSVCLLLQYLLQSCSRGGGGGMEDMCYERLRAKAGVN